ncbi:unnamed protein product [Orchesella dallaii]|uniref:3'-5' exonuclease domain-containing protein n=1 Tax=Orchesella dallaii TaxID=48710 RepID=A0ABP1PZJ9_9HEXA
MEKQIASAYHWRRQGLKICQLSPSAHNFRVELNASTDSRFKFHPSPATAQDFQLKKHHIIPIYDIPIEKVFMFIDNLNDLKNACDVMKCKEEITCDLEGDFRFTYNTITCLIQMSVDTHDFVIDAIKLYEHITDQLGPIFLNRSIVKIFFGNVDLAWLQRDFNIFVNSFVDLQNIYDTYNHVEQHSSFAKVVYEFLGIRLDKTFQRFPWQMRKIPYEALDYARKDTTFICGMAIY